MCSELLFLRNNCCRGMLDKVQSCKFFPLLIIFFLYKSLFCYMLKRKKNSILLTYIALNLTITVVPEKKTFQIYLFIFYFILEMTNSLEFIFCYFLLFDGDDWRD